MRTFIPKSETAQTSLAASSPTADRIRFGPGYEMNMIRHVQRTMGNRAVQHLMHAATNTSLIQRDAELDEARTQVCLAKVEEVIKELEATAAKPDYPLPEYITTAITLLRKKMTEKKIKCYAFSGMVHGRFKGDEIHIDGVHLDMINVTTLLHEAVHAEHKEQFPKAGTQYSQNEGKDFKEDDPKLLPLLRWKAYTEYWAYRARFDYFNPGRAEANRDSEEKIHTMTLNDPGVRVPMLEVRRRDPNFDPRKWKPTG